MCPVRSTLSPIADALAIAVMSAVVVRLWKQLNAADYVPRNRKNVARIFIHAPKPYRVRKIMEMYGDTEQEGKKSIIRSDAARASYYKSISGCEWGDAHQYELSADSSIGPEKTAELICGYISQM